MLLIHISLPHETDEFVNTKEIVKNPTLLLPKCHIQPLEWGLSLVGQTMPINDLSDYLELIHFCIDGGRQVFGD